MKVEWAIRWHVWRSGLQHYALGRDDEGGVVGTIVRGVGRALYVVPRWLEGGRRTTLAPDLDGTSGAIHEPHLDVVWGGACPVQGDGQLYGRALYYRSRGEGWELWVAGDDGEALGPDAWCYDERGYIWPDGGWVAGSVTEQCIRRAVAAYETGHFSVIAAWRTAQGER